MLLAMKARIEAGRALTYVAGAAYDRARVHPDAGERAAAHARFDLLTPVVKAWCADNGVDIASMGVQIHGGMGFIEETGAAQHYRDARILPIYEGTNGIQAIDLVGRKIVRDGAKAAGDLFADMTATVEQAKGAGLDRFATSLSHGLTHLRHTTDWLIATAQHDNDLALASATTYLALFGTVAGGWQMARQALAAQTRLEAGDARGGFFEAKIATARFYMDQEMPKAAAFAAIVTDGGLAVGDAPDAIFG